MDTEKFEHDKAIIIENQKKALLKQSHLAFQEIEKLDPNEITPLTPEIISR